jgi:hypothetical protein
MSHNFNIRFRDTSGLGKACAKALEWRTDNSISMHMISCNEQMVNIFLKMSSLETRVGFTDMTLKQNDCHHYGRALIYHTPKNHYKCTPKWKQWGYSSFIITILIIMSSFQCVRELFFLFYWFGLWNYWHCGHSWPIVPALGDDEDDCGDADGM